MPATAVPVMAADAAAPCCHSLLLWFPYALVLACYEFVFCLAPLFGC